MKEELEIGLDQQNNEHQLVQYFEVKKYKRLFIIKKEQKEIEMDFPKKSRKSKKKKGSNVKSNKSKSIL